MGGCGGGGVEDGEGEGRGGGVEGRGWVMRRERWSVR